MYPYSYIGFGIVSFLLFMGTPWVFKCLNFLDSSLVVRMCILGWSFWLIM